MFCLTFMALSAFIVKLDLSEAKISALIVGGENAEIEHYPYQVSLHIKLSENPQFYCGGSILTKNVILTAAHCTFGDPKRVTVHAGSSFVDKGGEVRNVDKIHVHPKGNNGKNYDYDIAILLLTEPFTFSKSIKPIELITTLVPDKTLAKVTGWGLLSEGGSVPKQLQVVSVPKVNHEVCIKLHTLFEITPRMTCYGYLEGGKDSCQGDSGGPIVVNNKQVGIVSLGDGCAAPNKPGVYTDIFNKEIMQFIKKFI